jgi:hypothetical protein
MRRRLGMVVIIVAACTLEANPAGAAKTQTDRAKQACVTVAARYRGSGSMPSTASNLAQFEKVDFPRLTKIVRAVRADDTDQEAIKRLGQWCKSHFPKVVAIQEGTFLARPTPTVTLPPTTTTLSVQPQHYEGAGDSVVDVPVPIDKPAIAHVVGNAGAQYFGVTSYGPTNNRLDLLVNTTDPYDGRRPLAFTTGSTVAHFEVKATSGWTIDVEPLEGARRGSSPGVVEGDNDDVIIVSPNPSRAHIVGNSGGQYFGVTSYGTSRGLLVNTTDPYDGTVLVPSNANFAFEIRAVGHWRIEFS